MWSLNSVFRKDSTSTVSDLAIVGSLTVDISAPLSAIQNFLQSECGPSFSHSKNFFPVLAISISSGAGTKRSPFSFASFWRPSTISFAPTESAYAHRPPRKGGNPVPKIIARASFAGLATMLSDRQYAASLIIGRIRRSSISEEERFLEGEERPSSPYRSEEHTSELQSPCNL